jgi:hypothetical protein
MRLLDDRIDRALDRRFPKGIGGDGGGIDDRLARVESKVGSMEAMLVRLEAKVDLLPKSTEIAELKGRISQLPTVWQMFGLVVAIFALAFALVRFGLRP